MCTCVGAREKPSIHGGRILKGFFLGLLGQAVVGEADAATAAVTLWLRFRLACGARTECKQRSICILYPSPGKRPGHEFAVLLFHPSPASQSTVPA